MSTFRCPHCGGLNKIIPQRESSASGIFQSDAPTISTARAGPVGMVRDFLHFMRGGKAAFDPQAKEIKTLRIEEVSEDGRHWLLTDLDARISLDELKVVAKYVLDGEQFSRPNSTRRGLSQHKHNLIADELKRLNMLFVDKANRSVLSPRGTALLKRVSNT